MKDKLKELGFDKWFSDYSEKHHSLKGWEEYDNYLDEVELPDILFLTLAAKWLREVHDKVVQVFPTKEGYGWLVERTNGYFLVSAGFDGKYQDGRYDTYEEALNQGILTALELT